MGGLAPPELLLLVPGTCATNQLASLLRHVSVCVGLRGTYDELPKAPAEDHMAWSTGPTVYGVSTEIDLKRSQRQKKIPYKSTMFKVSTSKENFFLSPIYPDKNSLGLLFQKMKNEPWQSMVYGDYLSVYTYPCDC